MNRVVAMKNYGFEWHTVFGLTPNECAARLADAGVDWVAVQNLVDPLPGSAVDQTPPGGSYDDRRVRDALRAHGLRWYEATAVFFQPRVLAVHPDLRPVDARGRRMEQFGWYVGLCPSSATYLAERRAVVEEVVTRFEPDGVFLSFIRFPGFWEMWLPGTTRASIPEYCFCDRCTRQFESETGNALPAGPIAVRAAVLQNELRTEWTRWKCALIVSVVEMLGAAARRVRPGTEVMVNGVAFGRDDYDNAVMEVLGQDVAGLSAPTDHVELMFYHQILQREPAPWIARVTAEARSRSSRTILACLQGKADYLDSPYEPGRRRTTIPLTEFVDALRAVAESPADGAMVYHWKDFLEDDLAGGGMSRALRAFKEESRPPGG